MSCRDCTLLAAANALVGNLKRTCPACAAARKPAWLAYCEATVASFREELATPGAVVTPRYARELKRELALAVRELEEARAS